MPFVLIPEDGTGLANANALASRDVVTACLSAMPFAAAWADDSDTERQDQCIAEASAWFGRLRWQGRKLNGSQAMPFPRVGMTDEDGYAVPSNCVPAWVVDGLARCAFWLSQQANNPFADSGLEPGSRLSLPGGFSMTVASGVRMPPDVRSVIARGLESGDWVERL